MNASEKTLTLFTTRVRQLILQYDDKKKEIIALEEKLKKRENQIKELEAKLNQLHNDYTSLKMAKMIEISDGDMEDAQKRLSKLIRDVNKCITLLSEKQ
ncbi:MAG: hypothetical protein II576_02705 [Prevotella sp.]|jgi:Skp family chaperone for outer membrane proteins|nr:hypothetical protein [Prevotella sp.]MBQ1700305.1 hypothetical protein [Prevotella sp.]MBQ2130935.1 hypothetical protein [Prevotella sp.]MBQ2214699.1 hypothetical protein [Prevotella sp.]MBQ2360484.1 hypothetical protein [Prevotella sp.]